MGQPIPDPERVLRDMLERIQHRGPDDDGTWTDGRVGLGHVRLSIIDPSPRGHQPFVTGDGRGVLSYNGEVYNFKALRRQLEDEGVVFRSDTDTEVVLNALHRWGPEAAVPRFDGMFALAYYDGRDGVLWLARDRLGIKPLYVAEVDHTIVFASEATALFAHPRVVRRADEHALLNLLLYERFEGTMTAFRGVQAVQPGTLCRVPASRRLTTITYFDVLRDVEPARIAAGGDARFDDQVDRFEELLRSSVHQHMVSDVPLATMCSGGFDSSLVTAFASEVEPDVVAFVADVEGMRGEEARRATLACQALDVELRVVDVDAEAYFRALPRAIQFNEQPLYFAQGAAGMIVAEAIRRDGFKVVLTGDGADELFGGYDYHAAAHRMWRRRRLLAEWLPDNPVTRRLGRRYRRFRRPDLAALAADPLQRTLSRRGRVNPISTLLIDGARRHLREARLFEKLQAAGRVEDRAFLTSSFEDIYIHLGEYLRTTDRMSMSWSIENRVPFLENDLIDFALHLPVSAKYSGGFSKRIVRRLAEKRLPRELIGLPKIGFGMNANLWRGLMPFLHGGRVAELLKWRAADEPDILALLSRQGFYQFRLLGMELWLRLTFDGESPELLSEQLLRLKRDTRDAAGVRPS